MTFNNLISVVVILPYTSTYSINIALINTIIFIVFTPEYRHSEQKTDYVMYVMPCRASTIF